ERSRGGELIAAAAALHLKLGQTEGALALYDRAAIADPRSPMVFLGLARADLAAGKPLESRHAANRSLALSDSPEAHLLSGEASEQLGRPVEARAEFTAAAHGATELAAGQGLARLQIKAGAVQDALTQIAQVLQLDPKRAAPHLLEGDCYEELGRHDQARVAYGDAVKLDPKNGEAAFKLGRAERDVGALA